MSVHPGQSEGAARAVAMLVSVYRKKKLHDALLFPASCLPMVRCERLVWAYVTPYRRVLPQNLTVAQLVKPFMEPENSSPHLQDPEPDCLNAFPTVT
jgi:hypothetical protein